MGCMYNCAAEAAGIDWPAWVQAIGSVIAIVFAVLVPKWTRRAEVTDRLQKEKAEALALATVMVIELESFRFNIYLELMKARRADPNGKFQVDMKAIPQSLWGNALSLPKLGHAGENTLRALYSIHRARDYVLEGKVVREDIRSYIVHLEKAEAHADAALSKLRDALDE